jgi:hypothetical protein
MKVIKSVAHANDVGILPEMISFGPSPAALYLLCRERDLAAAVTAIHATFFGATRYLERPPVEEAP